MPMSEERKSKKAAYDLNYLKQNVRHYGIGVNKILESDMVEWLNSQSNISQYIKDLIAADMRRNGK